MKDFKLKRNDVCFSRDSAMLRRTSQLSAHLKSMVVSI